MRPTRTTAPRHDGCRGPRQPWRVNSVPEHKALAGAYLYLSRFSALVSLLHPIGYTGFVTYTALLRDARSQAGLSVSELARRAETSRAAITAYENGRKTPSAATLERLLTAAGFRLALVPAESPGRVPLVRRYFTTIAQLAAAIRTQRESLGLSASMIADHAKTSAEFVDRLEQGKARGNLAIIRRILEMLNIEPLALPFELLEPQNASA